MTPVIITIIVDIAALVLSTSIAIADTTIVSVAEVMTFFTVDYGFCCTISIQGLHPDYYSSIERSEGQM